MDHRTERLLVRRILAGERAACEELVRLHHAPIYRLLVRLCRDADLAEDLTQEAFAAAWAGIGTFSGASSLATWLHRIAYRRFIDSYRRRRPLATLDENLAEKADTNSADPLQGLLADEESRRLYDALAQLDPPDRDILVLHYLQGLTFRQMAEVLDEPGGTVKWRTSQALAKLRVILDNEKEHENQPAEQTRASGSPIDRGVSTGSTRAEGA